jgi:hypothetical protein
LEGLAERFEKQPAEQTGQHVHGQEEACPAGDPAFVIGGNTAARNNTVQMRMMEQVLAPVTKGEEAWPASSG